MVMYATPADLASYLQKDLDTSSATLVLQLASGRFSQAADTWWEPQSVTYSQPGPRWVGTWLGSYATQLVLPFSPVTAVSAVRINGATVTGYTLIKNTLYRAAGFGWPHLDPPDLVEVDLTHGYSSATDDVKGAVLETAATAYQSPDPSTVSESIDDYSIRTAPNIGGMMLTPAAEKLASWYRVPAVA